MQTISEKELIEVVQNLKYLLYGGGLFGSFCLFLLGVIIKYLGNKLKILEKLEESIAVMQAICDERHANKRKK